MTARPHPERHDDEFLRLAGTVDTLADLAELLRHLRRRQGRERGEPPPTHRGLAARSGWSHGVIWAYLAGQVLPPTDRFDILVRLLGAGPAEQGALATARDRVEESRRVAVSQLAADQAAGSPPIPAVPAVPAVPAEPIIPRQLPPPVRGFVGRAGDLATLTGLADPPAGQTVVITGLTGVGKTTLAARH